jgi:hypothetical protein
MDRSRQPTPRAAVLPHTVRALASGTGEGQPLPLKEAIHLTTSEGDHTLYSERVLIGRGPHCRVVVLDPLVSREHALIRISRTEVLIEDLRSANGVYVNNVRIFEPCQLFDGDRILIGTNEIAVFSSSSGSRPQPVPLQTSSFPAPSGARPGVSTERADALEVLGRLANRMLAQGMPAEAERILADHLRHVLQGARSGLPVPPSMCAHAARFALMLAARLHNGAWVNYAIELHLRAELALAPETLKLLQDALGSAKNVDHALYGYYVEWLRESLTRLPAHARDVLESLEHLRLG